MPEVMKFLGSLARLGFDSWNTTYRMHQFSQHVPGYTNLTAEVQLQVVTNLDTQDLGNLFFVWTYRDKILPGKTFTEFVDMFILDPNATDTLLPSHVPTAAEWCTMYRRELTLVLSLFMIIPSTIILIILTFIKPRTNLRKDCLWGRPSLLVPINFIDEHGRRWAYCGVFAVMTSFLLDFFDQEYFWDAPTAYWNDEEWALKFSWIKPFILLGNVLHLGYLFYPLFACLSLRRHLPANILGLAYSVIWLYYHISEIQDCPIEPERGATTLTADDITRIVTYIPMFLGEVAVVFSFVLDLGINIYNCYLSRIKQTNKFKRKSRWGGKETIPLQYIEYLLTAHRERPKTLKEKIKRMFVYTNVIGFKYPPRVICTMCVAFVLLLSLTIKIGSTADEVLIPLEQIAGVTSTMEALFGATGNYTNPTIEKAVHQAPRYMSGIRGCFILANVVASVLHFGSMVHMVITYRTHVRMVMRGDRSWHFDYDSSPSSKLVYGMRYSGYQIAYLLWGYVIMFSLVAVVTVALTVLIIVPVSFGERPFFFSKIIIGLSTALGTLLISLVEKTIAKFSFLQGRGAHLALTNRRGYHIMGYFIFFFNIVVGVFSVLRRSLLSMLLGTLLLCRLDRCLLMRGFEHFDSGFSAYMGMLEVDATHNHPVLKGFIYILTAEVNDSKQRQQDKTSNGQAEKAVATNGWAKGRRIDKRIRNKWWKLITLVNNPVLVIERLHRKVYDERDKKHHLRDDVMDVIAKTRAVFKVGSATVGPTPTVTDLRDTTDATVDVVNSTSV